MEERETEVHSTAPLGTAGVELAEHVTDISERRRLEQDREKLLAQVEWERLRLREIFDAAPSMVALTRGTDHVYEYVNEAYCKFAGATIWSAVECSTSSLKAATRYS